MNPILADLLHVLELERIEQDIFRGESRDIGAPQVFGGQVLGQALSAASQTVQDRVVHSLHAYFLRRGDFNASIVFHVDRSRDGGSFSARRVVAIQHGRPIFTLSCSFQVPEEGFEHQVAMPEVPDPEGLADAQSLYSGEMPGIPEKIQRFLTRKRPFEFRPVDPVNFLRPEKRDPVKSVWLRATDALPDVDQVHRVLLAYVSDYELLGTAALPHGLRFGHDDVQMASLDHAMWFHRQPRVDEWFLYTSDSPAAQGGRGLARGMFFSRDGTLIASTAQEGLIRVHRRDDSPE
ncbi:MAG: acyl-CoA thioesterase II [Gammaproteobacteria bacterium]|nr:MAG: acyl-CoA thioesterase II [Gammaproteobacteria bacterium]